MFTDLCRYSSSMAMMVGTWPWLTKSILFSRAQHSTFSGNSSGLCACQTPVPIKARVRFCGSLLENCQLNHLDREAEIEYPVPQALPERVEPLPRDVAQPVYVQADLEVVRPLLQKSDSFFRSVSRICSRRGGETPTL